MVDIGWATECESRGLKFYNRDGQERECTALMKELGLGCCHRPILWTHTLACVSYHVLPRMLTLIQCILLERKGKRTHKDGLVRSSTLESIRWDSFLYGAAG